jgi:nucleotide-binding universal stress UspA family protein
MSIFPTKILLATDGSKEAELAFASAADLSEKTGSELYVVYVGHMPLVAYESRALQSWTRISGDECTRTPSKRLEQCSTSWCSG